MGDFFVNTAGQLVSQPIGTTFASTVLGFTPVTSMNVNLSTSLITNYYYVFAAGWRVNPFNSGALTITPGETTTTTYSLPPPLRNLHDDDIITFTVVTDPDTGEIIDVTIENDRDGDGGGCGGGYGGIIAALLGILGAILLIPNAISSLAQKIGDFFLSGFTDLFVLREDYFADKFGKLKHDLQSKIPIVAQISTLSNSLIADFSGLSDEPPEFKMEVFGSAIDIIDFSHFEPVRLFIHTLIIFSAYFFFIRRLIRKIPKVLGGIEK